jgi:hypothetical protein
MSQLVRDKRATKSSKPHQILSYHNHPRIVCGDAIAVGIVGIVVATGNEMSENDHSDLRAGGQFADFIRRRVSLNE